MAKKKKASLASSTATLAATLAYDLGELSQKFESFKAEVRFNAATMRETISAQTDRVGKQNGILDQAMRQTNAGFAQVKQDLLRAGQGLQSHELDITSLQRRTSTLETQAFAVKKPKSKAKR